MPTMASSNTGMRKPFKIRRIFICCHQIKHARNMAVPPVTPCADHTSLASAIHLYRKFGFDVIPLPDDCVYDRTDIRMALVL